MGNKAMEKSSRETGAGAEPEAPHPLDSWLKRELQGLDGEDEGEQLPPGIAELAARLEDKLRNGGGEGEDDAATTHRTREAAPGREGSASRRGRKR